MYSVQLNIGTETNYIELLCLCRMHTEMNRNAKHRKRESKGKKNENISQFYRIKKDTNWDSFPLSLAVDMKVVLWNYY